MPAFNPCGRGADAVQKNTKSNDVASCSQDSCFRSFTKLGLPVGVLAILVEQAGMPHHKRKIGRKWKELPGMLIFASIYEGFGLWRRQARASHPLWKELAGNVRKRKAN